MSFIDNAAAITLKSYFTPGKMPKGELGRIFKTEFILEYMSQPFLRRRVRRGLLKTEQLHSLARDVCYGKRGRITVRDLQEQMTTCSCLTLILASIIYWQIKEIERVDCKCDRTKMESMWP